MANSIVSTRWFVDTNALLYVLTKHPKYAVPCSNFLSEKKNLLFSSVNVLEELYFKLLTISAEGYLSKDSAKITNYKIIQFIKSNPEFVAQISNKFSSELPILTKDIYFFPITLDTIFDSVNFSANYSLLPSDAIIVSLMKKNSVENLVSYDSDFDNVEWIKRVEPK